VGKEWDEREKVRELRQRERERSGLGNEQREMKEG
jgi:hypothetical protein